MITGNIDVTNNIVMKSTGDPCLSLYVGNVPSGGTLNIYNNTFIGDDYTVFRSTVDIAVGGSVIAKNNIFGLYSSFYLRHHPYCQPDWTFCDSSCPIFYINDQ